MRTKKAVAAIAAAAVVTTASAAVVIAADAGRPDNSKEIRKAIDSRPAEERDPVDRDGAGDSELTIGRYYLNGAKGAPLAYETLPFTGAC